uniref:Cytochrome P450 n=1 Tax=Solanum tuberosum TaxID=4113 RepID=M0ZP57_SOLTU
MEEMDNLKLACIRLGNVHVIPVTSPELACEFLKIQDSVFSSRPICMSASLISNSYITSIFLPIGDQWMKMRRILASHVLSLTSFQWLRCKRDEEADNLHLFVYNNQSTSSSSQHPNHAQIGSRSPVQQNQWVNLESLVVLGSVSASRG